ncbi:beta-ketoacyl-ACP synthase III [Micromonospora echinofusca]|uniref:Beta-ketoacyl-[acyl-carrier-protein] synthase III n=1 Tax=Micromonospora echinofusca TaxID=47858 RepID=A0ABS3VXS3_MICEH|nr:beta-ketoacyl-ACP synthase III [Micromonospora echinofusca]MBO4209341.1 beta-ketoacyl-ACP synthase III [Micromonospora echinofusca]
MTTRSAVLAGVGGWVPPRVVTNADLSAGLDTSDEWIRSRTGIVQRHLVDPGTSTSDLAVEAARRALDCAGTPAVDAVVVATMTPDRSCPATAPEVASRLGLTGVAAYDVGAVCTGFVYALATAAGLIATDLADRVLVIGADALSAVTNPADRTTAVVLADGAGAVVLRAGAPDEPGALGPFDLGSDGEGSDLIQVAAGGARQRLSGRPVDPAAHYFTMDGREVFRNAVLRMSASSRTVVRRAGWQLDEVDRIVSHQANIRILNALADDLDLARDRIVANIDRVGNTGAASIPLALADAAATGVLTPGDRVLLTAFGGGLTWGSTVLVWPQLPPTEHHEERAT